MKIYVVGLGPGGEGQMTAEAAAALEDSDAIVGYTVYVDLVRDRYRDKELVALPMKKEVDRCRMVLDMALEGRRTALVCSGDPGVYGMAGLMCEVAADHPEVEIEIVAGITAACSGAACLGAPLVHDFAVISLSDLLTPAELIEKRLRAAGEGDFAVCLYNPSSRKRRGYLKKACGILMESRSPSTVCGYVRNIGRDGTETAVMTLGELEDAEVDMFTTVFIGSSSTKVINGRMVTPRGYRGV